MGGVKGRKSRKRLERRIKDWQQSGLASLRGFKKPGSNKK